MRKGLFVSLLLWATASLGRAQTVVYPTGSFPLDVQNVQSALEVGGTVILKSVNVAGEPTAFDFGPATVFGTGVNITKAVSIQGEPGATIRGGFIPILGLAAADSSIRGINFEQPMAAAILYLASTGAEITGNQINGVIGVPLVFGFTDGDGIDLFGAGGHITGRIRIADNLIENLGADFANGMQFDDADADIDVSGNRVRFPQSNGSIQTIGILAFRSHGRVSIVGNDVLMGPGPGFVYPVGIFIGGGRGYKVSSNTITTQHPNADGMDVLGFSFSGPTHDAVIEGNRIIMHSSLPTSGGIALVGNVDESVVAANRLEGTSGNALQVLGFGATLSADSNRLLGNDISKLTVSAGDLFFGPYSVDTLFAGECNSYVDLGVGNRVLCHSLSPAAAVPNQHANRIAVLEKDVQRSKLDAIRGRIDR